MDAGTNPEMKLSWLRETTEVRETSVQEIAEISNEEWDARIEYRNLNDSMIAISTRAVIHRDMEIDVSTTNSMDGRWTSFNVLDAGSMDVTMPDRCEVALRPRSMSFLTIKDWRAVYRIPAGTKLRHFSASINSMGMKAFFDNRIPDELMPLIDHARDRSVVFECALPGDARRIARGLIDSPLQGRLRAIELEAGITQILAHLAHTLGQERAKRLGRGDGRKVREARERLLADIASPPSLQSLAAAVDLTPRRLNEGFRSLYGMTVFELLRTERMIQARDIMERENVPLKQISYRVGYKHQTNFVNAFKAQFGAPPRRYLKECNATT